MVPRHRSRLEAPQSATALELAKRVVQASPKEAWYWGTYGVAQYRTGDWKEAVETLEKAIGRPKPDDLNEDARQ